MLLVKQVGDCGLALRSRMLLLIIPFHRASLSPRPADDAGQTGCILQGPFQDLWTSAVRQGSSPAKGPLLCKLCMRDAPRPADAGGCKETRRLWA